jgi:hypothetical protein
VAYPKRTIVRSRLLAGQLNGRLDPKILVTVKPLPGVGGADIRLIAPAARGYTALRAAGFAAGHVFKPTSLADSYRTLNQQSDVFRARYTRTFLSGRPYRTWNGQRWYQRPGTAVAAVPGTSNHGWAAAIDMGEERDSDAASEPLDTPTLQWLLANEQRFGFFHSTDSEPWHIDWFPGDAVPEAVLEYERKGLVTPMLAKYNDNGPAVETLQRLILAAGGSLPKSGPDGDYGDETANALKALIGGDGKTYGPAEYVALHAKAFAGGSAGITSGVKVSVVGILTELGQS